MGFSLSRALKRSASTLAITAAVALAGCNSAASFVNDDAASGAIAQKAPDAQDYVGGAAYWGAKYEANREDTAAALDFARNLRMMGGARQAVAVLKEVVMKLPDDARVMAEYGKALTAAGRAKDALPFLSRSIQMKGDDWTTLSAYGVALDQTGSHAAAGEIYQAALTLSPNNPVIESNLAMSMVLQGRVDQAELTLRRLVARPDATVQMRQNLAMVETLNGNMIEAEQLAREDLQPSDATNNIAVLRQLDARNAKISVDPLPPPVSAATKAPAILTPTSPAAGAAPAGSAQAMSPAATKPGPYMMAPIADDGDQRMTVPAAKPATGAQTPAQPTLTKQSGATSEQPAAGTKPIALNEATRKPTSVLRRSYDVYRKSPSVSVANAAQ